MSNYEPPKVWQMKDAGGQFASINRPTAGAREEKQLPRGEHPFQLYSMATPNGVKVTIMFEELLEEKRLSSKQENWLARLAAQ